MDNIALSVDPLTLDAAIRTRTVKAIEPDNSLVYDESKQQVADTISHPPGYDFAQEVERIWTEYPDGILDLYEEKLDSLPADAAAVKIEDKAEEDGTKGKDPKDDLDWEEMEQMRSQVYTQLNDARNELWYILELAKSLALSTTFTSDPPPPPSQIPSKKQKKAFQPPSNASGSILNLPTLQAGVEPPIIPPGTFTSTPAQPHTHILKDTHDLEIALAAKQAALEECSNMIDDAIEELQSMQAGSEKFWSGLRVLRDGKEQWAVVPKPDFGGTMSKSERARDVIIPYALDEAPQALRSRSLAAFDLDPTKVEALSFGARTYLRLQITLRSHEGIETTSMLPRIPESDDIRALMQFVQEESFEEDLFNQIRMESSRGGALMEDRKISIRTAQETVIFHLVDTSNPPPPSESAAQANLILNLVKLSHLRLLRERKARLISRSPIPPSSGPTLLGPILSGLRYFRDAQTIEATLNMFVRSLSNSGIDCHLEKRHLPEDLDMERVLSGNDILGMLRGEISLQSDQLQGITISTSAIGLNTITTSLASFPLSDLTSLPSIVSTDLSLQLLHYATDELRAHSGIELKGGIFMDELDESISLGSSGDLKIMIPAPYSQISAILTRRTLDDPPSIFDSSGNVGEWLEGIAEEMH